VKQQISLKYLQDGWYPPSDLPAAQTLSEDFARQTGMRLEIIRGVPHETSDQLFLIRKLLLQHSDGPDIVAVDQTWLGTLKDDLLDLRLYFPDEDKAISPALASSYIIGGKLLAIPYQNQAGVLEYRTDLLRKYGYERPPRTWKELETMALRIQTGERALGKKDFWGYIWPGAVGEPLTCNALEWQVDEGAGRIIERDGAISVNNPVTIRTWERARHWIGWISPPSVREFSELDAWKAFESGRSVFARVWAGEGGALSTRERPELRVVNWWNKPEVGEAGFAAMPAGSVARTATLGGAGFAISKYSRHPQEDATLIRFLICKELETFQAQQLHSFSRQSVRYGAVDVPGSVGRTASAEDLHAILVARPSNVSAQLYDQVSMAYSKAVHAVLTGEKRASDAASDLEQDLVRITGLHPGPPA